MKMSSWSFDYVRTCSEAIFSTPAEGKLSPDVTSSLGNDPCDLELHQKFSKYFCICQISKFKSFRNFDIIDRQVSF
jgi:hypothetical protein